MSGQQKTGSVRYQKRPVVIDAVQLRGDNDDEVLAFMQDTRCPFEIVGDHEVVIHTLEGDMRADKGDWIIRGIKGEFYPCKPDIFEATYEAFTEFPARTHVTCAACNQSRTFEGEDQAELAEMWLEDGGHYCTDIVDEP